MKKSIYNSINPNKLKDQNKELHINVNNHIHSPHSYSSFDNMEDAFKMAKNENVKVLGINDFYTINGFREFSKLAKKYKNFPLFNIELICMQWDLVDEGICVNHPILPGRTYITGKGLNHLNSGNLETKNLLKSQITECNRRSEKKILNINNYFKKLNIDIEIDFLKIKTNFGKDQIRERHLAEIVRDEIFKKCKSDIEKVKLLNKILTADNFDINMNNYEEIDDRILRKFFITGAIAFEPENTTSFLSVKSAIQMIIDMGGIPCYPLNLDTNNRITKFEKDKDKLFDFLIENNIFNIEIIPKRNNIEVVEEYAHFFYQNGFLVTFGTEHNTKKIEPIKVYSNEGDELSSELKNINYKSAAVIAAHQYLIAGSKEGYCNSKSTRFNERDDFIQLGKKIIHQFTS